MFFFFKQKTAYEMRISDWSSDVCSSDLPHQRLEISCASPLDPLNVRLPDKRINNLIVAKGQSDGRDRRYRRSQFHAVAGPRAGSASRVRGAAVAQHGRGGAHQRRSEEHPSELPSLIRIAYAVFCLK